MQEKTRERERVCVCFKQLVQSTGPLNTFGLLCGRCGIARGVGVLSFLYAEGAISGLSLLSCRTPLPTGHCRHHGSKEAAALTRPGGSYATGGERESRGLQLNEFLSVNRQSSSSVLNKADLLSVLSEGLSAEQQVVLSDETKVAAGDSASTGVLSVLSGVRFELMWHVFENG